MTDWNRFECWHELFDALCNHRGHYNNAALASALCRLAGRSGARDHEAADKNLRHWRTGRRLPLRRNAEAMASLLDVDAVPDLRARWEMLYRAARGSPHEDDTAASKPGNAWGWRRPSLPVALGAGLVLAGALLAGGFARGLSVDHGFTGATDLPTIAYNARVVLSVGASRLVLGAVGDCDAAPPSWEEIRPDVPDIPIGRFEDGGLATQMINRCGREILVRAVRFTGTTPGVEEVRLIRSYLRIEVTAPPPGAG